MHDIPTPSSGQEPRLASAYLRYLGELEHVLNSPGQDPVEVVRNRLTPKDDIEERALELAVRAMSLTARRNAPGKETVAARSKNVVIDLDRAETSVVGQDRKDERRVDV